MIEFLAFSGVNLMNSIFKPSAVSSNFSNNQKSLGMPGPAFCPAPLRLWFRPYVMGYNLHFNWVHFKWFQCKWRNYTLRIHTWNSDPSHKCQVHQNVLKTPQIVTSMWMYSPDSLITMTAVHLHSHPALLVGESRDRCSLDPRLPPTEKASGLTLLILSLFTEKLSKFCFKELILVCNQIWIFNFRMFIYFKPLHNTAYIFNAKLTIFSERLQAVLNYVLFCS